MVVRAALINDTSRVGHHGCTVVMRRIAALAAAAGIEVRGRYPADMPPEHLPWGDIDLVMVNGEGSLHGDRRVAFDVARWGAEARRRAMPSALINTVYQNNGEAIADLIRAYDLVFCRESASRAALTRAGIPAETVPDLSLTWRPRSAAGAGNHVVFGDSTIRATTRRLYEVARAIDAPRFTLMTEPPRLPDQPWSNRKHILRHRWLRLVAPLGLSSPHLGSGAKVFPDPETLVRWLSAEAAVLVTGRFHAACIALDLGLPVLAIRSNTHKIEALFADVGLEDRMIDLEDLPALARDGTLATRTFTSDERTRIAAFLADGERRATAMFGRIAALTGTAARHDMDASA